MSTREVLSTAGNIMSTLGDTMVNVGYHEYNRGVQYTGGIP